jgi:hypothetical protein
MMPAIAIAGIVVFWPRSQGCVTRLTEARMKSDNRLAVFCLIVLAILIAGIMVEKFWDCRLHKGLSEWACLFTPAPYSVP